MLSGPLPLPNNGVDRKTKLAKHRGRKFRSELTPAMIYALSLLTLGQRERTWILRAIFALAGPLAGRNTDTKTGHVMSRLAQSGLGAGILGPMGVPRSPGIQKPLLDI